MTRRSTTQATKRCHCQHCLRSHPGGKGVSATTFYSHRRRERREQEWESQQPNTSSTRLVRPLLRCECWEYPGGHFLSRAQFYRHRKELRLVDETGDFTGSGNVHEGEITDGNEDLVIEHGIEEASEGNVEHESFEEAEEASEGNIECESFDEAEDASEGNVESESFDEVEDNSTLQAELSQLLEDQPFGFASHGVDDTSMYSLLFFYFILLTMSLNNRWCYGYKP